MRLPYRKLLFHCQFWFYEVLTQLGQMGVVPVVAIEDAAYAVRLGRALLDGGLPCAEITFRPVAAQAAIRAMLFPMDDLSFHSVAPASLRNPGIPP